MATHLHSDRLLRSVDHKCRLVSALQLLMSVVVHSLLLKCSYVYLPVGNCWRIELGKHTKPISGNAGILATPELRFRDVGGLEGSKNTRDNLMICARGERHGDPNDSAVSIRLIR